MAERFVHGCSVYKARQWMLPLSIALAGCASPSSSSPPVCDLECGAHEICSTDGGGARCECAPGYAGEPCEWTGGVRDSDFGSADPWAATNGAVILPLAQGPSGPGIASFASSVTCTAGAVSQLVEMPQYEDADPFVVRVRFRLDKVNGVDVGYNRAFRRLRATRPWPEWNEDTFCLGEAGYGRLVKFQVAATEPTPECFTSPAGTIEVDSFEILVADEGACPAPGELVNGRADYDAPGGCFDEDRDGTGGWCFDEVRTATGTVEAGLEPGVGESGSSAARIYRPAESDAIAGMYTQLSVPLATTLSSPALRFWWKGKRDWSYYVDLGTYPGTRATVREFDSLTGDEEAQTTTYCLPPWTHGNVADLSFVPWDGLTEADAELVIDNVEIVSDSRCGNAVDLLDPSFDSAPNRWPGVFIGFEQDGVSSVRVINDPERAHPPGAGVLELRVGSNQSKVRAYTWVWVPPSDGDAGPQLVFYSNVPADLDVPVFWLLGAALTGRELECTGGFCPAIPLSQELPKGLGWQRNTACLPAEWTERWYQFRVANGLSDEPLETYDTPQAVLLDDFELTTDEACPAL